MSVVSVVSTSFFIFPYQIFYPINNTDVGQGTLNNVVIRSNMQTNLTFPFSIDYKTKLDPGNLILRDLAQKCGLRGSKSDLTVKYKITVSIVTIRVAEELRRSLYSASSNCRSCSYR